MDRKRPTLESARVKDADAAGAAKADASAEDSDASPMDRFTALTRRLLSVSREDMEVELRRHAERVASRKAAKRKPRT